MTEHDGTAPEAARIDVDENRQRRHTAYREDAFTVIFHRHEALVGNMTVSFVYSSKLSPPPNRIRIADMSVYVAGQVRLAPAGAQPASSPTSLATSRSVGMEVAPAQIPIPNPASWFGPHAPVGLDSASYYTTTPLRQTLIELVDLDYLNGKHIYDDADSYAVSNNELHLMHGPNNNSHFLVHIKLKPDFSKSPRQCG